MTDSSDVVMRAGFSSLYLRTELLARTARMLLADMEKFKEAHFSEEPTWTRDDERNVG